MRFLPAIAALALVLLGNGAQACGLDLAVGLSPVGSIAGNHRILITVAVTEGPFQSNPGLQHLQFSVAGTPVQRWDFHDVSSPLIYEARVPMDDHINRVSAEIVFDPAGNDDGNPANNDCNPANNRASLRIN